MLNNRIMQIFILNEMTYRREPFLYCKLFLQRQYNPFSQKPCSHRCNRLVQNLDQRNSPLLLRKYQFQVPYRKAVQPDILFFLQPGNAPNVPHFLMLRLPQIMQDNSGSNDSKRQRINSITLQSCGLEMAGQLLESIFISETPFFQLES